jgi:hypothetical protein
MDAVEVVLANEDRTGDYLPAGVNLSFASEPWLRTVPSLRLKRLSRPAMSPLKARPRMPTIASNSCPGLSVSPK